MANQKNTDTEVVTTELEPTVEEPVETVEPVTEEPVAEEPTHSLVEEVTKPKAKWKKADGDTVSWPLTKEEFVNESNLEVAKYVWEHTDKKWEVKEYNVMTITKTSGGNYVEIVLVHEATGWLVRFTSKEVLDQINKVINKFWATMNENYTVTFNWMSIGWRVISFLAF